MIGPARSGDVLRLGTPRKVGSPSKAPDRRKADYSHLALPVVRGGCAHFTEQVARAIPAGIIQEALCILPETTLEAGTVSE